MVVQWDNKLLLGDTEIDIQHQEFFRRLSALLAACDAGKGREEILQTVSFLDDYVVVHFGDEEALLLAAHHPGYQEHYRQHRWFIGQLMEIKRRLDEGVDIITVFTTARMLAEWYGSHINVVDRMDLELIIAERRNKVATAV